MLLQDQEDPQKLSVIIDKNLSPLMMPTIVMVTIFTKDKRNSVSFDNPALDCISDNSRV